MNRREFMTLSAGMLGSRSYQRAPAIPAKPNIFFIIADDLGYGDLGCYGQKRIATPNIDRIAAEGMRFTQAYAGNTVCAPSRCSLMTGLHTGHCTVRGNKKPELGIRSGEITAASLLKRAGYETAMFGKWGLGGPATGSVPNTRGFDTFFGYLDQQHARNYYPEHLWENQNEFFLTGNWFNQRKQYAPDLFTRRCLDFLKRPRQSPFFVMLTYTTPHADNELGAVTGNGMEVPGNGAYRDRDWPELEKNFAAMVTRMDSDIGSLMAQLAESRLESRTLVLFASDNGPHKEGGHDPDFFNSNGPLNGIKRDLYEGGIRIPFLARWPGVVPAGTTNDAVIAFWDFLPTVAELSQMKTPPSLDGISFSPALLDSRGHPQPSHKHLYWEFHERGFAQAVRVGDWKGVRLDSRQAIELYDLKSDVAEKDNVAAAHKDVVAEIDRLMAVYRTESPDFPVGR